MNNEKIKVNQKFNYKAILDENNPLIKYPALYEASINEFSQKVYEDASLNDILKSADMSKSSLYHHFGDKFGLYLATLDIIVKKKIEFLTPLLKNRMPSGDFFKTMRELSRDTVEFMFKDKRLYSFTNMILASGESLTELIHEYFPYDFQSNFGGLIAASIRSGQIDSKYPPEFVTKLLSLLFTNMDKLLSSSKPEDAFESLTMVFDVLENGIRNKN
ncbi:MAG: hypothetical protein A2Y17_01365 [Clostridiales bacterium GWF2_38_85]|nr:MAG: hypothetical protein A2Y17_01365 [Clostridiales bacterium GWF2_38_85]HBL85169.1 hypothetical protein [Clostridiales bacterium]